MHVTRREAHEVIARISSPSREDPSKINRDSYRHLQRTTPFTPRIYFPTATMAPQEGTNSAGTSRPAASVRSSTPTERPRQPYQEQRRPPIVPVSSRKVVGVNPFPKGHPPVQSPPEVDNIIFEEEPCDYEKIIRHMLLELNLPPQHDENPLLDNVTNGVLLCELLSTLEGRSVVRYHQAPHSLLQIRENYQVALEALRAMPTIRDQLAPGVLDSVRIPELLQGYNSSLWPMLYHVLRCYASRLHSGAIRLHSTRTTCYSPAYMSALEAAVCQWLLGLTELVWPWNMVPDRSEPIGPLNAPYIPPRPAAPTTSGDSARVPPKHITCPHIFPYLQNGTLLAELTIVVMRASDTPISTIKGVTANPRRESAAKKNIEVVLDEWKGRDGMATVYVCHPAAVQAIFAGDKVFILLLLEDMMRFHHRIPPRRSQPTLGDRPYLPVPATGGRDVTQPYLPPPICTPQQQVLRQTPTPQQTSIAEDTPAVSVVRAEVPAPRLRASPTKPTVKRTETQKVSPLEALAMNMYTEEIRDSDIEWVRSTVRKEAWGESSTTDAVPDFSSGVLLWRLVEALERTRDPLVGMTENPKTVAARRTNLRRALDFLKVQRKLFAELLFLEDHLLVNNTRAIATVIRGLRKFYRR